MPDPDNSGPKSASDDRIAFPTGDGGQIYARPKDREQQPQTPIDEPNSGDAFSEARLIPIDPLTDRSILPPRTDA